MKKFLLLSALYIFCSCGDSDKKESSSPNTDETGLTNPSAIDTIKHPSGVDNSSVISTDTAAMNVQNSLRKADSARADSTNKKP